jgi:hypothetical protein
MRFTSIDSDAPHLKDIEVEIVRELSVPSEVDIENAPMYEVRDVATDETHNAFCDELTPAPLSPAEVTAYRERLFNEDATEQAILKADFDKEYPPGRC